MQEIAADAKSWQGRGQSMTRACHGKRKEMHFSGTMQRHFSHSPKNSVFFAGYQDQIFTSEWRSLQDPHEFSIHSLLKFDAPCEIADH